MNRLSSKNDLAFCIARYAFVLCLALFVSYSFADSERWSYAFFIYGALCILLVSALLNIRQLDETFTGFITLPIDWRSLQGCLYILAMIILFLGVLYGD